MSDFMATGSTGTNYGYVQEKFVFTEDDNSLKFAIGGFIRSNTLDSFVEDENLKIVVKTIIGSILYTKRNIYRIYC